MQWVQRRRKEGRQEEKESSWVLEGLREDSRALGVHTHAEAHSAHFFLFC